MKHRFQITKLSSLLGLLVLFSGCATDHVAENHQYMPHKEKSYVVRGHTYSFAVYNSEHRLLTHPIEELLTEMKWRKALNKPAISDVYFVSHGWNYTLPVAIANYHSYMERVDAFMNKQKKADNSFQPYFIFVTWTSTTRPTTDLTKAVLPFGIDSAVEPITSVIDKAPLHIITAWKQSGNAGQNALGAQSPNYYLKQDWSETPYGYLGEDLTMGEDLPVSGLIYKLIQLKNQTDIKGPICHTPDPLAPADDVCVSLTDTKIHLVGHSYGAKLIALAGMEALRHWMLEGLASYPNLDTENNSNENCIADVKLKDFVDHAKRLDALSVSPATGHLPPLGELFKSFAKKENNKPCLLKFWYDTQNQFPINSLVLFNPAFSPGEFSYPVEMLTTPDLITTAPTDTLRFIPRKAIVYSNSDYANGALYSIRDLLLNAQLSQYYQLLANLPVENHNNLTPIGKFLTSPPVKPLFQAGFGAVELGYATAYSLLGHAGTSVANIPYDFGHHIQTGTLDGWVDEKTNPVLKGIFNGVDFFLPIKLTRMFGNPTQGFSLNWPLFFLRDETQQGLFRLNRPGLGKTGLNHLTEGRSVGINLWGLANYYDPEITKPFGNYPKPQKTPPPPFAINIDADTFCKLSSAPLTNEKDFAADESNLREYFYSFDASKVYDSKWPPVGAHSDLRDTAAPNGENCCNKSTLENGKRMEKRDFTFNFLLNFTKGNFVNAIKNQESKSKTDSSIAQEKKP